MKKRRFPDTYLIIFALILISAVATWLLPGGTYMTSEDGTVNFVEKTANPQTWQVFSAFMNGFVKQSQIIVFVLIIGGAFWVVNQSKAVEVGIKAFITWAAKLEKNRFLKKVGVNNIVMVLIMLLFSLFGAVFGMSEETIAFVAILVPLAISMGYDSITGLCLVYVAAHVGFSGAFLNPFTVGIAQNLSGVPMFSGIEYRFICWCILNVIMIAFVLTYASKVKKNPKSSIMYEADGYWREHLAESSSDIEYYHNKSSLAVFGLCSVILTIFTIRYSGDCSINIGAKSLDVHWLLPVTTALFVVISILSLKKSVHFFIMNILCFTIVYLVIGVLAFEWYLPEISALFVGMAIASGIASGLKGNDFVKEFLAGAKDIMSAALVIGLAAGIVIILQDGNVMDSILHSLEASLGNSGKIGSLYLMYAIETVINLFIPSATAKAAITMPIMAPFSDIIGISRQATVTAFQFGDGFTNMITPTSGVLIAALAIAKIPYSVWVKYIWKFILALIILGAFLLIPTVILDPPGF